MRRTEKHGPGGASLAGRVLAALLGVVLSAGLVPARGLAEAVVELGGPVASAAETIGEIEAADGSGAPEAGRAAGDAPRAAEGTDAGDGEDEGVTLEAQDEEVTYLEASLDASGAVVYTEKVVPSGYTLVTSSNGTVTFVDGGWYVVDGLVTYKNSLEIDGNVNLVLKDGCEYNVNDGIHVVNGDVLNVYAQSEGESAGLLKARVQKTRIDQPAAIGSKVSNEKCGSLIIHGGRIDADSSGRFSSAIGGGALDLMGKGRGYDGGAVTVYGGVVEATSDKGFAIGGGAPNGNYAYGSGGTVAVYGGTVTAKRTTATDSPAIGAIGGSDGGTLTIGPGLRVMGSGDGGSTYDVLIANGPCTNLEYASRTPYMRIEPAPEPPLPEIEGVSWLLEEPLAGWNGGPESTHHYKVVATATKGDGTTATSEKTVPYASGGSSADFSDFAGEQGDGSYVFEVTACDENGAALAYGRSDPQPFYRVSMRVSVLDEGGEPLEGDQHGCSVMLVVNGRGASSDYQPVQCRVGGTAKLLAWSANGYRFMGFSVDGGDTTIDQNPYEFNLDAGFDVIAAFRRDSTEIPVTLRVGVGHEDFARQIADALNSAHGEGYAQVGEGGVVTYETLGAQTMQSAANELQSVLWTLGQPSPGYLLGASPSYASYEDYRSEMYGEDPTQLGDGLELYLVWYQVVPQVDVAVDAPVCGTQVTVDGPEWHPEQTPAPAVDVDGDDAACGGSWWSARGETVAFSGTIEGGATYTAHVSLSPAFGCVFDDTTAVRANGKAVEAELGFDGLAVEVPVVAEHDWAAGACAGCSAQQRTVAFDANGGAGEMASVHVAEGQVYTLTACGFTAPAGKAFAGWLVGDATSVSPVGAAITVSGDVTLRAAWAALPSKPEFRSCYLVLSGLIGVTFTVAVPQGFEAGESRMDFKVRGEASSSVRMAGLEPDAYGRYHFTCYINSVQMADSISATLLYGEGLSVSGNFLAS